MAVKKTRNSRRSRRSRRGNANPRRAEKLPARLTFVGLDDLARRLQSTLDLPATLGKYDTMDAIKQAVRAASARLPQSSTLTRKQFQELTQSVRRYIGWKEPEK